MKPNDIKAIIFDCFGVFYLDSHDRLVEYFPAHQAILEELRHQNDHGWFTRENYLQAVARATGANIVELGRIILTDNQLNQPLVDFVRDELKPRYKIGLLSNVGRGWMDSFFDPHKRAELFDAVVLSGDEGVTKPHPQIYELVAERLQLEPWQCLMIDDLPENAAGADAAGMRGMVYGNVRDLKQELGEFLHAGSAPPALDAHPDGSISSNLKSNSVII